MTQPVHTLAALLGFLLAGGACAADTDFNPDDVTKADYSGDRRVVFDVVEDKTLIGNRAQYSGEEDELEASDDGTNVRLTGIQYQVSSYADPITIQIENPGLLDIAVLGFQMDQRSVETTLVGDPEGPLEDITFETTYGDWTPVVVDYSSDCPGEARGDTTISVFRSMVLDWEQQSADFTTMSSPGSLCADAVDVEATAQPLNLPVSLAEFGSVQLRIRPVPIFDRGELNGTFDYLLEVFNHNCVICG